MVRLSQTPPKGFLVKHSGARTAELGPLRTMLIGDDGGSGGDATDAKMMTTQAEGDDDDDDGRRSC